MLGYIPRTVQLKLFRYALSKLDFLDHSTYDVERDFNLSLGLKNELQMKNISLNVEKLTSMLALPPSIQIKDAKVSLLHIRIPTDFHKAPVKVTISGVVIEASVVPNTSSEEQPSPENSQSFPDIDAAGHHANEGFKLPSGMDLTSSFLQDRPTEAREVEVTLESEFDLNKSVHSDLDSDSDDEDDIPGDAGLGTPLSFWNFVPSFFQRLVDRVEIDIKAVSFRLQVPYEPEDSATYPRSESEFLTVQVNVESLEIEGVTLEDSKSPSSKRSRQSKAGMRAVRFDGISVALIGRTEFFEGSLQFGVFNPEDTETIRSDSTILPPTTAGASSETISPNAQDSTSYAPSHTFHFSTSPEASTQPNFAGDQSSNSGSAAPGGIFFARMEEPPPPPPSHQNYDIRIPRTSLSPHLPSSPESIDSDELDSRLLSQSMFLNEDHALTNSDINLENSDGENDLSHFVQSRVNLDRAPERSSTSLPTEQAVGFGDGDESDDDSLENEPRRFDLYHEPNTKFLGVSSANIGALQPQAPASHTFPSSTPQGPQFHNPETQRPQTLLDIPENASNEPSLSHPHPTFGSGNPRATFLEPIEYTYYEEAETDVEYSNPDLLYLSEPIGSNPSSMGNSMVQQAEHASEEALPSSASQIPVEPKVIYSKSDSGEADQSDSESVYQSYPASEVDASETAARTADMANSISPQEDTTQVNESQNSTSIDTHQRGSPIMGSTHSLTRSLSRQEEESEPMDLQKVRGHVNYLPLGDSMGSSAQGTEIADLGPSSQEIDSIHEPSLSRVSSMGSSEAALGESMIFTHEEAGSLYMSALGGSQPTSQACHDPPDEGHPPSSASIARDTGSQVRISKTLLNFDYIDIFVPGIASMVDQATTASVPVSSATFGADSLSESSYPTVPGAFSVYAASRTSRLKNRNLEGSPPSSQKKLKPNVSFEAPPNLTQTIPGLEPSSQHAGVDIEIGVVNISIDLAVGKRSVVVFSDLIKNLKLDDATTSKPNQASFKSQEIQPQTSPPLNVSITSFKLSLVENLPGKVISNALDPQLPGVTNLGGHDDKDTDTPLSILTVFLKNLTLKQTREAKGSSSALRTITEIGLLSGGITIGEHQVMGFMPTTEGREPRRREKSSYHKPVFRLRITNSTEALNLRIHCVPIRFYFPTRSIEDMISHFGGLESMLSLASSSSISPPPSKPPSSKSEFLISESSRSIEKMKTISLNIDISGVSIEVFVSEIIGGIGLSTSSINIKSSGLGGLSVQIPQLALFGPDFDLTAASDAASTLVVFEGINISLDDTPTDEDLERLLGLITPSTDRYGNSDDVMIDVLLRQRRKGSVVRIDVKRVHGTMKNSKDTSRFIVIAEELAKMGTVAKYIPQDERPGMLTLLHLKSVNINVFANEKLQDFVAELGRLDVCHIAAPSLLALAVGQISLIRKAGAGEEWIGESLPRALATTKEEDRGRPMVRMRMIGDEPEPEIKIKIWNTRLEYYVEPVQDLFSLTEKDTTDVIATNMVDSIANLAEKEVSRQLADSTAFSHRNDSRPSNAQPMRINVGLSEVCVGLNPLNMNAKALFIIQEGSLICQISAQEPFSASLALHKAKLVAIDNNASLIGPQRQATDYKHRRSNSKEDVSGYISQGYVSFLSLTSAKLDVKLEDDDLVEGKNLNVKVSDVFIIIESCADSTQTVINILNGLKMPLPESEEIKYKTEILPVDVFANLDEDAFVPTGYPTLQHQPRDLQSLEDMPEDFLEDEVPFNSQLIESYYPSRALPPAQPPSDYDNPSKARHQLAGFHDQVRVVAEEPLNFDDGYFPTNTKDNHEVEAIILPRRKSIKATVRNVQLIWNLHDGYDWGKTRETISKAVQQVEEKASKRRRASERMAVPDDDDEDEETETYDVLFNSIYITLPKHRDPKDLSRDIQHQISGDYDTQSETGSYAPTVTTVDTQVPGRRHQDVRRIHTKYRRSRRNAMQFELKGVDVDLAIFAPDGSEVQSSVDVRVEDIQVTENIRTSTWRLFLTYMREAGSREKGSPMAHIHLDTLRPVPELAATELSIKVKLLPLRLYVDQDALEFLTRFFEFKDPDAIASGAKVEEPFIQRCEIDTVRVKLDFKPKRVDYAGLRSGKTTEFMNFFILDEADMELRHVALNGVSGFERLGKDLNNIWMPDIKQNQLGGVLAGVAPVRSLVNIGTGVRDLVKVPIMEYRKDGRLVRSIKKGTQHFVKTSGSEFARLGAKLAVGTQNILEKTEGFLVGESSQPRNHPPHREGNLEDEDFEGNSVAFSPYANQPLGVYRGLVQARDGFTRNMNEAREAIMRVPSEAAEGGSAKSAAAAILRAAPTTIIRPMIGVTEAVHNTLHGIDNSIDPEKREKLRDKYKKGSK